MSARAAMQRDQVPVAVGAVLDQRDRQLAPGDLGGDQVEAVAADDDDPAGARGAREAHGVDQQRLAADLDERLGEPLGQSPEAAPETGRQQHHLHRRPDGALPEPTETARAARRTDGPPARAGSGA